MSKQNGQGRIEQPNKGREQNKDIKRNVSTEDIDKLQRESDKQRTKKPGSQRQSGGSGRHNNGRGGGK